MLVLRYTGNITREQDYENNYSNRNFIVIPYGIMR